MGNKLSDFLQSFESGEPEKKTTEKQVVKPKINIAVNKTKEKELQQAQQHTEPQKVAQSESQNGPQKINVKIKPKPFLSQPSVMKAKEKMEVDLVRQNVETLAVEQEIEDEEIKVEKLFLKSETPLEFKSKWMEIYDKALYSKSNTLTNKKILSGRFRVNQKGNIEILADYDSSNKTTEDMLTDSWFIDRG